MEGMLVRKGEMKFLLIGGVTHDLSEVEKTEIIVMCRLAQCTFLFPFTTKQKNDL